MRELTRLILILVGITLMPLASAQAADSVSCPGKRSWQRDIVRDTIFDWFEGQPDPDHLVDLVQAEHGIVACSARSGRPRRLHTVTLTRGLAVDQLGAVLLANELEWRGLVPTPEVGLAGRSFRVHDPNSPHRNSRRDTPFQRGVGR